MTIQGLPNPAARPLFSPPIHPFPMVKLNLFSSSFISHVKAPLLLLLALSLSLSFSHCLAQSVTFHTD